MRTVNGMRTVNFFHQAVTTAVVLLSVIVDRSVEGADWPTYRRDNARAGFTPENLTIPLKPAWTYASPSPPRMGWSGDGGRDIEGFQLRRRVTFDDALHVSVVGGRLYFGSSADHQVHCRDARTGEEIWSFFTGGAVRLAPTVGNNRVYFGSDDGYAYCLDAESGRLVWKLRAGPADEWIIGRGDLISRWPVRTSILVADGIAYFAAGIFPHEDVYIYAVDADDGTVLWKRDNISEAEAGRNDLSPQGYLLATDSILVIPSGRSLPAAIDRQSGKIIHKRTHGRGASTGGVVGGTRALLADGQIYAQGAHFMFAMDQKTGDVGFGTFEGHEMAVAGDSAYLATGTKIVRLNRKKYRATNSKRLKLESEILNLTRRLSRSDANAAEYRARIPAAQKELDSLQKVGRIWQTPSHSDAALLVAGKLLFAGGRDQVQAFNISDGKEVWTAKVDGEARGIAIANGHLYVSTTSGRIHAFLDAATKGPATAKTKKNATNPFPKDKLTPMYAAAAEKILKRSGVNQGFCLVVGSEQGRLAYELVKRSHLKIYGIEPNAGKVEASRRALASAGLYGSRVIIHQADLSAIPYSNYFANLIVSDSLLLSGQISGDPQQIARHLKPIGGVLCLGAPEGAPGAPISENRIAKWLEATKLGDQSKIKRHKQSITLTRGKLPGAANWSHHYAEPGNTASSEDRLVKGGLGVLWYGDPGPGKMVNRHEGAVGPLSVNGRLFVQATDRVMAYDAYNGMFLWEYRDEKALRTGVFQNYNPGNLVASDDSLFVLIKDIVVQLDAATGKVQASHGLPNAADAKTHEWGYVAYLDGRLFGTATVRKELERKLRRRGRKTLDVTDTIFAIDVKNGQHLWSYNGKSISHRTIALGSRQVFFIDSSITSEQRAALLAQDKSELKKLKGDEVKKAEERMKRLDARMAVALDAKTGKKVWSKPVDVTDCSDVGTGGGKLTLMVHNNVLVLCGANANGHYWKQFTSGEFSRRRLVALSAEDGHKLWAKDANYRHRPIVIEDQIIAEPWGFDLYTGEQKMRTHPLTGAQVPWSIMRPGHHCGMLTGCPGMLMFRSGYTGFYDLEEDAGTRHFAGHRLGCWINAIPANGLVMIPEASAGCVCLFSISSTIIMEPRAARRPWSIYSSVGPKTPVKHMALNLGAPGDRKDARGTVWLAYPRPSTVGRVTGLDLALDIKPTFLKGGGYDSRNSRSMKIDNAETPWLFTSSARGLTRFAVPLLGPDEGPAFYSVRLYFAEVDGSVEAGQRVFDVKLQGKTVQAGLDVVAEAEGRRKALVRRFDNVHVTDHLVVELLPRGENPAESQQPSLSAIEVTRSDDSAGK